MQRFAAGDMKNIATGHATFAPEQSNRLTSVYYDSDIEQTISHLSVNTFGVPLFFNRLRGDERFRVGQVDYPAPTFDQVTREYVQAVNELPLLADQGDGMKSFIGLATAVLTGQEQILLIDEPEAFLHPPQAKALGRWVGRQSQQLNRQIFFSTHDSNFLLGLLESGSSVCLLHLTREGTKNHLYELNTDAVQDLWKDPVLHYSNVLQGLFCQQAVICEADADCRFFYAGLSELAHEKQISMAADETLFIPANGKSHVPAFASTLTPLHTKLFTILDFDVLRVKNDIKKIVESFGHIWDTSLENEYMLMARGVNGNQRWEELKHTGISGFPSGEAYQSLRRLVDHLAEYGILILPVGELEDLDKNVASEGTSAKPLHGAKWVNTMLKENKHKTNSEARKILSRVLQTFVVEKPSTLK